MKLKFFSVPAIHYEDASQELNAFCANHKVASLEKQFASNGENSYWAICITYEECSPKSSKTGKSKIDYREELEEHQFTLFAKLRSLRKTMAEREGVPVYALFTNEQLADMVRGKVTTLSEMSAINGIGKGRLEKYGTAFIQLLKKEISNGGVVQGVAGRK